MTVYIIKIKNKKKNILFVSKKIISLTLFCNFMQLTKLYQCFINTKFMYIFDMVSNQLYFFQVAFLGEKRKEFKINLINYYQRYFDYGQ